MAREGLMDDCGWHGFDDVDEFVEKYCCNCAHDTAEGECAIHGIFLCGGADFEKGDWLP